MHAATLAIALSVCFATALGALPTPRYLYNAQTQSSTATSWPSTGTTTGRSWNFGLIRPARRTGQSMPAFDGLDRAYDFEFFTSTTAFQNGQSFSEQGTLHQTSAMIEVVVRPDSLTTTGAQTIWETGGTTRGVGLYIRGSTLSVLQTPPGVAVSTTLTASDISGYALVTVAIDTVSNNRTLYVNGERRASLPAPGATPWSGSNDAGLASTRGNSGGTSASYGRFQGRIGRMAIWENTLFTDAEVSRDCGPELSVIGDFVQRVCTGTTFKKTCTFSIINGTCPKHKALFASTATTYTRLCMDTGTWSGAPFSESMFTCVDSPEAYAVFNASAPGANAIGGQWALSSVSLLPANSYHWQTSAGSEVRLVNSGSPDPTIPKAFSFDGTSMMEFRALNGTTAISYDVFGDHQAVTLEIMFRVASDSYARQSILWETGGIVFGSSLVLNGATVSYRHIRSGSVVNTLSYTIPVADLANFVHVAVIIDNRAVGAAHPRSLYVNGALRDSLTSTEPQWTGTGSAGLAGVSGTPGGFASDSISYVNFKGDIAFFAVYRNATSAFAAERSCGPHPQPVAGSATCNGEGVTSTCSITCLNSAYQVPSALKTSTCYSNRLWSTAAFSNCPPITCPLDTTSGRNHLTKSCTGNVVGSVCNYACPSSVGSLSGSVQRQCQSDGTWSGAPSSCNVPIVAYDVGIAGAPASLPNFWSPYATLLQDNVGWNFTLTDAVPTRIAVSSDAQPQLTAAYDVNENSFAVLADGTTDMQAHFVDGATYMTQPVTIDLNFKISCQTDTSKMLVYEMGHSFSGNCLMFIGNTMWTALRQENQEFDMSYTFTPADLADFVHVTIVYDFSTRLGQLFVNGRLVDSGSIPTTILNWAGTGPSGLFRANGVIGGLINGNSPSQASGNTDPVGNFVGQFASMKLLTGVFPPTIISCPFETSNTNNMMRTCTGSSLGDMCTFSCTTAGYSLVNVAGDTSTNTRTCQATGTWSGSPFSCRSSMPYMSFNAASLTTSTTWSASAVQSHNTQFTFEFNALPTTATATAANMPSISKAIIFTGSASEGMRFASNGVSTSFSALPDMRSSQSISLEFWLQLPDFNREMILFETGDATSGLAIIFQGDVLIFAATTAQDTHVFVTSRLNATLLNTFFQLITVVDRDTSMLRVFINGMQIGATPFGGPEACSTLASNNVATCGAWSSLNVAGIGAVFNSLGGFPSGFIIGTTAAQFMNTFQGQLALFNVYDYAVSPSCGNVARVASSTVTRMCTGTSAYDHQTCALSCTFAPDVFSGSTSRMCQLTGTFSGSFASCSPATGGCSAPGVAPGGGSITCSNGHATGSVCTYSSIVCPSGQSVSGLTTLTCISGKWTATAPTCESNRRPTFQVGQLTGVGSSWRTVTTAAVPHPAVFALPQGVLVSGQSASTRQCVPQVRNVVKGSFQIRCRAPQASPTTVVPNVVSVPFMVAELGTQTTPGGRRLEVGSSIRAGSNIVYDPLVSVPNPVVFSQMQTLTADAWVHARQVVSSCGNSIGVRLEVPGGAPAYSTPEQIVWVALTQNFATEFTPTGLAVLSRARLPSTLLAHGTVNYPFTLTLTEPPLIFAQMQSIMGGDPAITAMSAISTTHVTLRIQEEQVSDTETAHVPEKMGFFYIQSPVVVYSHAVDCGDPSTAALVGDGVPCSSWSFGTNCTDACGAGFYPTSVMVTSTITCQRNPPFWTNSSLLCGPCTRVTACNASVTCTSATSSRCPTCSAGTYLMGAASATTADSCPACATSLTFCDMLDTNCGPMAGATANTRCKTCQTGPPGVMLNPTTGLCEDVNVPPYAVTLSEVSVAESAAIGTVVGTLSTQDYDPADTSFTYTLDAQIPAGLFALASGNQIVVNQTLDHEASMLANLTVTSTDAGGLSLTVEIPIVIGNVEEAPTNLMLTASSVVDGLPRVHIGSPVDTVVGTLSATDNFGNGGQLNFAVVSSSVTGLFTVRQFNVLMLALVPQASDAVEGFLTVTVQATDAQGDVSQPQAFRLYVDETGVPTPTIAWNAESISSPIWAPSSQSSLQQFGFSWGISAPPLMNASSPLNADIIKAIDCSATSGIFMDRNTGGSVPFQDTGLAMSGVTFEALIKPNSLNTQRQAILEAGGDGYGMSIVLDGAVLSFHLSLNFVDQPSISTSLTADDIQDFVKIALVVDNRGAAPYNRTLYVNGQVVGAMSAAEPQWSGGDASRVCGTSAKIGGFAVPPSPPYSNFDGQLALLNFYNRPLTTDEVTRNCGSLPVNSALSVSCVPGNGYASQCSFGCFNVDEELSDATESRLCTNTRLWSGFTPVCQPITCDVIPTPYPLTKTCTNDIVGATCTISCATGMVATGSTTRTCGNSGAWDGTPMTCALPVARYNWNAAAPGTTPMTEWQETQSPSVASFVWSVGSGSKLYLDGIIDDPMAVGVTQAFFFDGGIVGRFELGSGSGSHSFFDVTGLGVTSSTLSMWFQPSCLSDASKQLLFETGGTVHGTSIVLMGRDLYAAFVADSIPVSLKYTLTNEIASHMIHVVLHLNVAAGTRTLFVNGVKAGSVALVGPAWTGNNLAGLGGVNTNEATPDIGGFPPTGPSVPAGYTGPLESASLENFHGYIAAFSVDPSIVSDAQALLQCGTEPSVIANGVRVCTGTGYRDTCTLTCNTGFSLVGNVGNSNVRTCQANRMWSGSNFECRSNIPYMLWNASALHSNGVDWPVDSISRYTAGQYTFNKAVTTVPVSTPVDSGVTRAIVFDGSSSAIFKVNTVTTGWLNIPGRLTAQSASIEIWFRIASSNQRTVFFEVGGNVNGLSLAIVEGYFVLSTSAGPGNVFREQVLIRPEWMNTLTQALLVVDDNDDRRDLYINGERVITGSFGGPWCNSNPTRCDTWAGTDPVGLGNDAGTTGGYPTGKPLASILPYSPFVGEVALIRVYDSVLSSCTPEPSVINAPGTKVCTTGAPFYNGQSCTMACPAGAVLVGSAYRECLPNGQWSGMPASCELSCPDPGMSAFGTRSCTNAVLGEGVSCTYTVNCTGIPNTGPTGVLTTTCVGGAWTAPPPTCAPLSRTTIQMGTIHAVSSAWQTVTVSSNIQDPIAFAQPAQITSTAATAVCVPQIRNVAVGSFEIRCQPPTGASTTTTASIGWLVVEQGVHTTPGGLKLMASRERTDADVLRSQWPTADFSAAGIPSTALVLSQTQTYDNGVPGSSGVLHTRQRNVAKSRLACSFSGTFQFALEETESTTLSAGATNGYESVGWMAVSAQTPTTEYTSATTFATLFSIVTDNVITHTPASYPYGIAGLQAPPVVLGQMQTYDGVDPSSVRITSLDSSQVTIMVQEDQTFDTEVEHTTEVVGLFSASEPVQLQTRLDSCGDPVRVGIDTTTCSSFSFGTNCTQSCAATYYVSMGSASTGTIECKRNPPGWTASSITCAPCPIISGCNVAYTCENGLVSKCNECSAGFYRVAGNSTVSDKCVTCTVAADIVGCVAVDTTCDKAGSQANAQCASCTSGAPGYELLNGKCVDVNNPPSAVNLLGNHDVVEGAPSGTLVGQLITDDLDTTQSHLYAISGQSVSGLFQVIQVGPLFFLATLGVPDFEPTNGMATVTVVSTDSGVPPLFISQQFTIAINDTDDAPTAVLLSANSVLENQPANTEIGVLSIEDVDDTSNAYTYTIVPAQSYASIGSIVAIQTIDSGATLRTVGAGPNFEEMPTGGYPVAIQAVKKSDATKQATTVFMVIALNANDAPTDISLSLSGVLTESASVGTPVGVLQTKDEDSSLTFTYTITSQSVPGAFGIEVNSLVVMGALDFESTNGNYSVRVRSTDSAGAFFEKTFFIGVGDSNDLPTDILFSTTTVSEAAVVGSLVGTLSTVDPDPLQTVFTYSLVVANAFLDIPSGTNEVRVKAAIDYESLLAPQQLSMLVQTTDSSGGAFQKTIVVSVLNANDPPTNILLSSSTVDEGKPSGTLVGTLSSVDPEPTDTFTYSIVAGSAAFQIVGDQLLTAQVLSFAAMPSAMLTIQTTDAQGGSFQKTFTITVSNTNDAPTAIVLSGSHTIAENTATGTTIGMLSTVDPDTSDVVFTYAVVASTIAVTVQGSLLLIGAPPPNYELLPNGQALVTLSSTDAMGASVTQSFNISVTNVAEPPVFAFPTYTFAVDENTPIGSGVGVVLAMDSDLGSVVMESITSDTSNGLFVIDSTLGLISVNGALDAETAPNFGYKLTVTATSDGMTTTAAVTITVTDVNEAPIVYYRELSVRETAAIGTVVGSILADDPENQALTYSIDPATNGPGYFNLASSSSNSILVASALSFTATPVINITVVVRDTEGFSTRQTIKIVVTDVNTLPIFVGSLVRRAPESLLPGEAFDTPVMVSDADVMETFRFSISGGDGASVFSINATSGQLHLNAVSQLDYETKSTYRVGIVVIDSGGVPVSTTYTIDVVDRNDPPVFPAQSRTISENSAIGAVVGAPLTATDSDLPPNAITFSIASGNEQGYFSITSAGQLKVARAGLNYEFEVTTYYLTVTATDAANLPGERSTNATITISVTNVAEAPTSISLSPTTVNENEPIGTIVGVLSTVDPDDALSNSPGLFSYAIVGGTGQNSFRVFISSGLWTVRTTKVLNFESDEPTMTLDIQSTDTTGLRVTQTVTVTLVDVNEAGVSVILNVNGLATSKPNVPYPSNLNAVIGQVTAVGDPDTGDTHTCSVTNTAASKGTGEEGTLFRVLNGVTNDLVIAQTLSKSKMAIYDVTVTCVDAGSPGLTSVGLLSVFVPTSGAAFEFTVVPSGSFNLGTTMRQLAALAGVPVDQLQATGDGQTYGSTLNGVTVGRRRAVTVTGTAGDSRNVSGVDIVNALEDAIPTNTLGITSFTNPASGVVTRPAAQNNNGGGGTNVTVVVIVVIVVVLIAAIIVFAVWHTMKKKTSLTLVHNQGASQEEILAAADLMGSMMINPRSSFTMPGTLGESDTSGVEVDAAIVTDFNVDENIYFTHEAPTYKNPLFDDDVEAMMAEEMVQKQREREQQPQPLTVVQVRGKASVYDDVEGKGPPQYAKPSSKV